MRRKKLRDKRDDAFPGMAFARMIDGSDIRSRIDDDELFSPICTATIAGLTCLAAGQGDKWDVPECKAAKPSDV